MFADVLWGPARWWPAFVVAVPITWWCLKQLKGLQFEPLTATASQQHDKATLFDRYSVPLFMSYAGAGLGYILPMTDRKSTRLNSSHVAISYAVFCLKKKIKPEGTINEPE